MSECTMSTKLQFLPEPNVLCRVIVAGYLNNPEATANTIDKDGWLHTGDIAFIDEDEEMFIVDRVKEIIKFKGFQVPNFTNFVTLLSRSSKHPILILRAACASFDTDKS